MSSTRFTTAWLAMVLLCPVSAWAQSAEGEGDAPPAAEAKEEPPGESEAPPEDAPADPPADAPAGEDAPAESDGVPEVPESTPSDEAAAPPPDPAAGPVEGDDAEADFAGDEEELGSLEELLITGTRIKRKDLTTPAPVKIIHRKEIMRHGQVSLADILQDLPSQSNAINLQFNNGGNGASYVNLRGLGEQRTLLLINGRRMVPGGNGADFAPDLNAIPAATVERIEILKDGASPLYGSDAIGGVVNVITRDDFDGAEANVYLGTTPDGLAETIDLNMVAGQSSKRGSIVFSAGYFEQLPLWSGSRDFAKFDKSYDFETKEVFKEGSSATPEGTIIERLGDPGNAAWQDIVANNPSGDYWNDPDGGWRDMNFDGTSDAGTGDLYNYQPENYLLTPQTRYNFSLNGSYQLGDFVRAFFEGMYLNRRSEQKLAPTPLFTIVEGINTSADNFHNPFGRDFIDVRRRFVEAGNRADLQDIDTFRLVLGIDGNLPSGLSFLSGWAWDASFNFGRTEGTNVKNGRFVRSRVERALGPSFVDADGVPQCGTAADPATDGCVPLNLFGGPGTITKDMLDYISYQGIARGYSDQRIFQLNFVGDLFELWGGSAALALGYANRRETGGFIPDPITGSGDTTGNKEETTEGGYTSNEAYLEISLPILANITAVEALEVSLAGRYHNFDTFGDGINWKVGGLWQIIPDVAVRGTFSTAFRAPNVADLFLGQTDSFEDVTDPCDTSQGPRDSVVDANCLADGLNDTYTDDRDQIRTIWGGSDDLEPETAEIFTVGAVFQPRWVEGLSLAVDYWNIDIDNSIQRTGADVILNNCYGGSNRSDCDRIIRDPATGFLRQIIDTNTNIGGVRTAGIDFALYYDLPTDVGRFGYSFDGTWLHTHTDIQPGGREVEGVAVYDLDAVYPVMRFNTGIAYQLDDFEAGVIYRFVSGIEECDANNCDPEDPADRLARDVAESSLFDVYVGYTLKHGFGATRLALGMNNIFNSPPPRIFNGFLATSDAATYDYVGRYLYLRLTHTL